jgi:hypothetical protein
MCGHTASHTVLMTVVLLLGLVASVGAQRSRTSGSRRTKMSGVDHTGTRFPRGLIDFAAF